MSDAALYLLPVPLGPMAPEDCLPPPVLATIRSLDDFVVEEARSARAFLKAAGHPRPLQQIAISELNEHTRPGELAALLAPLRSGRALGLLSEAGCPAVADPGADLVALAQSEGFRVVPHIGPSSILLALMASGLGGQHFAFHGYLPAAADARGKRLRELELESRRFGRTQIFIETPYRNRAMFETLAATLAAETRLTLATDISLRSEQIHTRRITDWRQSPPPELDRRPTVFLFRA